MLTRDGKLFKAWGPPPTSLLLLGYWHRKGVMTVFSGEPEGSDTLPEPKRFYLHYTIDDDHKAHLTRSQVENIVDSHILEMETMLKTKKVLQDEYKLDQPGGHMYHRETLMLCKQTLAPEYFEADGKCK